MPTVRTFARCLGALCLAAIGSLNSACDIDTAAMAASESVFAGLQQPSPAVAARWANDPYDADKRYRGTNMLLNAPFGGEDVYVKMYRMKLGGPPATEPDTDAGVRAVAARALGVHGEPADTRYIVPLLKESDRRVRLEAVRALQRLHNPDVLPALFEHSRLPRRIIKELPDGRKEEVVIPGEIDKDVRAEACDALGQYADRSVAQALIDALDDDDLFVTDRAHRSLNTLTGQDFGEEQSKWLAWFKDTPEPFSGQRAYIYPVFVRDKIWWEYIPFWPDPPNEVAAQPAGSGPADTGGR